MVKCRSGSYRQSSDATSIFGAEKTNKSENCFFSFLSSSFIVASTFLYFDLPPFFIRIELDRYISSICSCALSLHQKLRIFHPFSAHQNITSGDGAISKIDEFIGRHFDLTHLVRKIAPKRNPQNIINEINCCHFFR